MSPMEKVTGRIRLKSRNVGIDFEFKNVYRFREVSAFHKRFVYVGDVYFKGNYINRVKYVNEKLDKKYLKNRFELDFLKNDGTLRKDAHKRNFFK